MEKNAIKTKLQEKWNELNVQFSFLKNDTDLSSEQVRNVLSSSEEMTRLLSVYEFLLNLPSSQEKEESFSKESSEIRDRDENKSESAFVETKITSSEVFSEEAVEKDELEKEVENENSTTEMPTHVADFLVANPKPVFAKKLEFSINDKYRILNELFHQNQTEFNMVISELNAIENISQAELYLAKLCELYEWKAESSLVKSFFTIVRKRFA